MSSLTALLGESPISTMGGLIGLLGLIMLLMGLAFDEDKVVMAGLGAVSTAVTIIGLAARDNRTSAHAHDESLEKIAEAKRHQERAHIANAQKIDELATQVAEVPPAPPSGTPPPA